LQDAAVVVATAHKEANTTMSTLTETRPSPATTPSAPAAADARREDGPRTRGWLRRRLGHVLFAVGLAAGAVALTSAPAHASSPRCGGAYLWYRYDSNGDAALAAAYSPWIKPTQPFHYWVYTPVSSSNSPSTSCWLGVGHTGTAVKALQTALNNCYGTPSAGYVGGHSLGFKLAVDGVYGSKTSAAVLAVQRYLNIGRDGVYGPQTAGTMRFPGETGNDSGVAITNYCHTFGS